MYKLVVVGGTFDGIHRGHEAILRRAFEVGEKVVIGLTTDAYVKKFKKLKISGYAEREKKLKAWLREQGWLERTEVVSIDDPFEPAASMPITNAALLVTLENKDRGEEINRRRRQRNLTPFALIEIPLVLAQDSTPISATRIRNGEIDKKGNLILPDALRGKLRQPLGRLLKGEAIERSLREHQGKIIITVGDVATKTFLEAGITPSLLIIDNKVGRQPYTGLSPWRQTLLRDSHKVQSGPGYITSAAIQAIRAWSQKLRRLQEKPYVIEVDGEEDLLTLPATLEAPLGSVLYYGQPARRSLDEGGPGPGMVEVVVTEGKKREVVELLNGFVLQ